MKFSDTNRGFAASLFLLTFSVLSSTWQNSILSYVTIVSFHILSSYLYYEDAEDPLFRTKY